MANGHAASEKDRPSFARACKALERVGRAFGISSSRILARARRSPDARKAKLDALASELELGGIQCPPQTVMAAATSLAATAAAVGAVAIVLSSLYLDATALAAVIILALLAPPLCHQCVMAHPRSAARRRASDLLKSSADAVNLMVMGIRQDAFESLAAVADLHDRHAAAAPVRQLVACAFQDLDRQRGRPGREVVDTHVQPVPV